MEVPVTGEATLDAALEPLFAAFEAHAELSPLLLERVPPPEGAPLARAVECLGRPTAEAAPVYAFSAARAASRCSGVIWFATSRIAVASTAASSVKPSTGNISGMKSNGRMK